MLTPARVVVAAVLAGGLGVVASLALNGPGPLLGTEVGQRVAQDVMARTGPAAPDGVKIAERGAIVPAFDVALLDGGTFALPAQAAGQPLLVNVWASWCGPCIEEMPELERFARTQGADGVQVLGLALDDADAVRDFLQRIPVTYPIAIDAPGNADGGVRLGNPRGVLPYTALLDAEGRLVKTRIGPFAHGEIEGWAGAAATPSTR